MLKSRRNFLFKTIKTSIFFSIIPSIFKCTKNPIYKENENLPHDLNSKLSKTPEIQNNLDFYKISRTYNLGNRKLFKISNDVFVDKNLDYHSIVFKKYINKDKKLKLIPIHVLTNFEKEKSYLVSGYLNIYDELLKKPKITIQNLLKNPNELADLF